MNKYKYNGFTLVELMISLFIFALLLTVLFSVFYQTVQSWSISEGLVESQQDGRIASDWLTMELHEAIYYYSSNSSVITPNTSTATSTNLLVFTESTGAFDTGLISTFVYNTVTYSLSSGFLIRTVNYATGVSSTFEVAGNIQTFYITHTLESDSITYNPNYFTVSVYAQTTVLSTVTQVSSGHQTGVENYALITDVGLRNYRQP
jgi:prepilin-type N-terminal cleavage/methylation domain-containing protein